MLLQVLNIVYFGTTTGGFFPQGIAGRYCVTVYSEVNSSAAAVLW